MLRVRVAFAVGLTFTVLALGIVLSHTPLTLAGTNGIPAYAAVNSIPGRTAECQGGGTLPASTSAIRMSLAANAGPEVSVKVLVGSTLITKGEHEAGWGIDETVTVPVKRVRQAAYGTRVCWRLGPVAEKVLVNGARVQIGNAGQTAVWLRLEYLRPGSNSWLSRAAAIARHMGIAHAPGGSGVALLLVVGMLAATVLVSWQLLGAHDE